MNERPIWRRALAFLFGLVRAWWRWAGQRTTWKGKVGAYGGPVVGVFVLLALIGSASGAGDKTPTPTATATNTPTTASTPTARPISTFANGAYVTPVPRTPATIGPIETPKLTASPDQLALQRTADGFFQAYDTSGPGFLALVEYIDPLSTCSDTSFGGGTPAFTHAMAYQHLRYVERDRWEVVGDIDVTGPDPTTDRGVYYIDTSTARIGIRLAHISDDQTRKELDPTDVYAYSLRRSDTSPTGWVFTADEEYAASEQFRFFLGPYEPLPDVGSYCGP